MATLVCERCGHRGANEEKPTPTTIVTDDLYIKADWVLTLTGVVCNDCWQVLGKPHTAQILDGQPVPPDFADVAESLAFERIRDLEAQTLVEQRTEEEVPVALKSEAKLVFCSPSSKKEIWVHLPSWKNHFEAVEALVKFFEEAKALQDPRLELLFQKFGIAVKASLV